MRVQTENRLIETEEVEIQCGEFQGDSLSPLLSCINLIPLTEQLIRLNTGYKEHTTKTKRAHLLYMDDLKLLGKSEEELQKQVQTVTTSVMISTWNLGLTSVQRLYLRKEN
jgi:hypothetical protein